MNFDEDYNGKTLLKDWWGKVKNNFSYLKQKLEQEISDRGNAITAAIEAEETARNSAISEAVAEETSQREAADTELTQTKVDKIDGCGLVSVGDKALGISKPGSTAITEKKWEFLRVWWYEHNGKKQYTEVTIPAYVSDLKDSSDYVKKAEMDDEPTADSDNPVKSGGVKAALDKAAESCMAAINEANIKAAPHTSAEGYPITISDHLNGSDLIGCKIYGNADGVGKTITGGSLQIGNLVYTTYTELPIVQRGKNLFDISKVKSFVSTDYTTSRATYATISDGIVTSKIGVYANGAIWKDTKIKLPAGTYTLSADCMADKDTGNKGVVVYVYNFTLGKTCGKSHTLSAYRTWERLSSEIVLEEESEVAVLIQGIGVKDDYANLQIKIKNVQLEMGNSATAYEEYKENTVTAFLDNALGNGEYIDLVNKKLHSADTVTDIMMVTGDLALLDSERVTYTCDTDVQPSKIEVSYHQDINKVIKELKNAILSQGGNV